MRSVSHRGFTVWVAVGLYLSHCRSFDDNTAVAMSGGSGGQAHDFSGADAAEAAQPIGDSSGGSKADSAGADSHSGASGAENDAPREQLPTWREVGDFAAHAAIAINSKIYALGSTWLATQGWRIQQYDVAHPSDGWEYVDSAAGTTLSLSTLGELWAYGINDIVWQRADSTGWISFPNYACGGGGVALRQLPTHNNLAVAVTRPFVITDAGEIRSWTGSCWSLMPSLPTGIANEIAIHESFPWAANGSGNIFRWSGTEWLPIRTGLTTGLNNQSLALGSDSKSLWSFNGTDWLREDWTSGTVVQLGSTYSDEATLSAVSRILITNNDHIWVFGRIDR